MKRIIFILCIFFGISLSACPLAQNQETPTKPETDADKWIKLVAGKRTEHSEFKNETIVFDDEGNVVWTIFGTQNKYNLVLIHDATHAVYQSPWGYIGVSIKDNQVGLYSQHVEKAESINWESTLWMFGTLHN